MYGDFLFQSLDSLSQWWFAYPMAMTYCLVIHRRDVSLCNLIWRKEMLHALFQVEARLYGMTSHLLSFFDSVQYFENLLCVTVCWPSAALGSSDVLGCGCQSVSWSPGCISALQNDAPCGVTTFRAGRESLRNMGGRQPGWGGGFNSRFLLNIFKLACNYMQCYICNNILQ